MPRCSETFASGRRCRRDWRCGLIRVNGGSAWMAGARDWRLAGSAGALGTAGLSGWRARKDGGICMTEFAGTAGLRNKKDCPASHPTDDCRQSRQAASRGCRGRSPIAEDFSAIFAFQARPRKIDAKSSAILSKTAQIGEFPENKRSCFFYFRRKRNSGQNRGKNFAYSGRAAPKKPSGRETLRRSLRNADDALPQHPCRAAATRMTLCRSTHAALPQRERRCSAAGCHRCRMPRRPKAVDALLHG